jgi:formylglycine-generating enzyme required for sulfatase activity
LARLPNKTDTLLKANFTEKINGMNMIYVKGGTYTMGCTAEQSDCWENEKQTHKVTVSSFFIATYELTLARFKQFVDSSGYITDAEKTGWSYVKKGGAWIKMDSVNWRCGVDGKLLPKSEWNHPVINISWNDAKAYCDWLSKVTGKPYRLPTEAEWEFASRGGNKSEGNKFSGGNKPGEVSWYADNSENNIHAVGQKTPNELGLYDMSGNVWEWCSDWDGDYSAASQNDPKGPETGVNKILRGGSFLSFYWSVRTTNRNSYDPANSCTVNGFRVVMGK